MRGKMDTKDHATLATYSLWVTLRTISVMTAYQRHGIENHPAISSEYVRFLVALLFFLATGLEDERKAIVDS